MPNNQSKLKKNIRICIHVEPGMLSTGKKTSKKEGPMHIDVVCCHRDTLRIHGTQPWIARTIGLRPRQRQKRNKKNVICQFDCPSERRQKKGGGRGKDCLIFAKRNNFNPNEHFVCQPSGWPLGASNVCTMYGYAYSSIAMEKSQLRLRIYVSIYGTPNCRTKRTKTQFVLYAGHSSSSMYTRYIAAER